MNDLSLAAPQTAARVEELLTFATAQAAGDEDMRACRRAVVAYGRKLVRWLAGGRSHWCYVPDIAAMNRNQSLELEVRNARTGVAIDVDGASGLLPKQTLYQR
jgi:Holliday junction resolvase